MVGSSLRPGEQAAGQEGGVCSEGFPYRSPLSTQLSKDADPQWLSLFVTILTFLPSTTGRLRTALLSE